MTRYLIIFLILSSVAFRGSNTIRSEYRIEWNGIIDHPFNPGKDPVLGFVGAIYPDEGPLFPVFSKIFPVEAGFIPRFALENPVFMKWDGDLPDTDTSGLMDKISIQVEYKRSGNELYAHLTFIPVIRKDGSVFLLDRFSLRVTEEQSVSSQAAAVNWKTSSVLASGKWARIKTSKRGVYKIPYDKLITWGFTSPALVNVYGHGGTQLAESLDVQPVDDLQVIRSWHGKDGSGKDCLFFYATGNILWQWDPATGTFRHSVNVYSTDAYYFLSQQGNSANTVQKVAEITDTPTHQVVSFDEYTRYESELVNLIKSGKQWLGEAFQRNASRNFSLAVPDPVAGRPANVLINAVGRSSGASFLDVLVNGVKQTSIGFSQVNIDDETSLYADERRRSYTVAVADNKLDFSLAYSAANNLSNAWLDYIVVNWRRNLRLSGDELFFRDTEKINPQSIARFQVEGADAASRVFDVTNPAGIFEIPVSLQGNLLSFIRPAGSLREYMIFKPGGAFPEPDFAGEVANQNLHGLSVPDFLIITHPEFLNSSEIIADYHRNNDGLSVEVVQTNQVYNEFGSGSPDATAIRNFIRMLYDRSRKLRYVMLVGDGTYDNRNILGANRAFVPTFQSDNSLSPTSSFVTDDYFVILDSGESVYNGTVDLGIGRLPVSTKYEAEIVTRKILNYNTPEALGEWRNIVCFIGDDGDGGMHMSDSEKLADIINSGHREFQTEKIYFDAFPVNSTPAGKRYPGVTDAINQRVKDGVLVLNYVGHANDRFLSEERVIDVSVINSWTNQSKLPIFVTATCEFSRFDSNETSAGEYILLNPNGGGIGLFSTTRVVFAYSNFLLSQNFYRNVFEKDSNGENFRMGDIMRLAKINTINTLNKRNFTLLANPALRLSYPRYRVETKTVNGREIQQYSDTLGALDKVTVTGQITDHSGNKLSQFNGSITPVVYDKARMMRTLGNSGQNKVNYKVQNNIIYKGLASVTNGEFSFTFVIPKDISYNIGEGKIIYYAENGKDDANGAFEGFYIGGAGSSQVSDNKGPAVELYMDDRGFRSGGRTGRNPLMIAEISDENGINTVGSGIGHDITAILNHDYSTVYILNDFYRSVKDDYTRGVVEFPFRNLPLGKHSLRLKVWDVANNSTEEEIEFEVTGDFYIEEVVNYPNPVSGHTYFTFTHNQPDATFQTLIEIFDLSGRRVDVLQFTNVSSGKNSTPVRWDPAERGVRLRNGIYPYRVTIRSGEGELASGSGKLMIGW